MPIKPIIPATPNKGIIFTIKTTKTSLKDLNTNPDIKAINPKEIKHKINQLLKEGSFNEK
jgi:hypothetical protein